MKRLHSILLVSVLLLAMLTLFGCQSKELTSAKVYIQQDDWEKAQEQLLKAVELYPNDPDARALLGEAYGRKGEFEKMDEHFNASLAVSPKNELRIKGLRDKYWVESFNKGVAKVKSESFDEALTLFKMCHIIDPVRPDAYKNVAFVYLKMDSTDAAIKYYLKVLEADSKDTKTMIQLGTLYYQNGKFEETIELMEQILRLEPDNIDAFSQKAFAYDSMGETDKAFDAYNEALTKKPGDPDLLFNLGRLYYMKKDFMSAINEFKKVLENTPDDYETILNIGNAYLSKAEENMKPLREGKEMTTKEAENYRDNAVKNYKEAIPYLEKAAELKPDDASLWTNLGVAYINAGMKEKGEAAFKKSEEVK